MKENRFFRDAWPWFLSFGLIVTFLVITYPSLTLHPQVWAEAGMNYFYAAHEFSLWENIWYKDAGYLPWFARLIALLGKALAISPERIPFFYQWMAVSFNAALASFLALPWFRPWISSDGFRVFVAVAVGTTMDYEMHTLVNFAYFGVVPFFMILAQPHLLLSLSLRQAMATSALLALLALSKGLYLSFALPLAWLFWRGIKTRQKRWVWGFGTPLLAIGLQMIVMVSSGQKLQESTVAYSILEKLWFITGYFWTNLVYGVLGPVLSGGPGGWSVFFRALALAALVLAAFEFRRPDFRGFFRWPILVCVLILLTQTAMLVLAATPSFVLPFGKFPTFSHYNNRFYFFGQGALFLTLAAILFRSAAGRRKVIPPVLGIALVLPWFFGEQVFGHQVWKNRNPQWPGIHYSQWDEFVALQKEEILNHTHYCIPLNPYPHLVRHQCTYLLPPPSIPETVSQKGIEIPESGLLAPVTAPVWKVVAIGLALISPDTKDADRARRNNLVLIALDVEGKILAQVPALSVPESPFVFFGFKGSLAGIHRLALKGEGASAIRMAVSESGAPVWLWLGSL